MDIAISGIGVISSAGINLEKTVETFEKGINRPGRVTLFKTDLGYPVFEAEYHSDVLKNNQIRTVDLAFEAVEQALNDACLPHDLSGFRVGVCMGTTVASQLSEIQFYSSYRENNPDFNAVDRFLASNLAQAINIKTKAKGPELTVVNACSSSTDAIGVAMSWLRAGLCDIAIAGGADELSVVPYCGFGSLKILSNKECAPFDENRDGLNLGEGAGILILETEKSMEKRKTEPHVYVSGYGTCADSYHLTSPAPDGKGLEKAIEKALYDSNISAQDVCFINAHGTATRENDKVEGRTFAKIFGPDINFLSTKGFTGHTLGASGGLEAAFTITGLKSGWIPKTPGFKIQDNEIKMSPTQKRTIINGKFALSTSLGFGGVNSALAFRKA